MKKADDLDAVRAVVAALEPFSEDSRKRIVRWAEEKLSAILDLDTAAETRPEGSVEKKTRRRRKAASVEHGDGAARPAGTQGDI